jgi:hypothetical protein
MYVLLEKQKYFACGLKIPDQVGNDSWGGLVRTSIKVEYTLTASSTENGAAAFSLRKPGPASLDTGLRRYGSLAMGKFGWGYGLIELVRRIIKDYNSLIVNGAGILRRAVHRRSVK